LLVAGLHSAHHGLAAGMHMDVFHRNLLLTLAAIPIESVKQRRV
jgi:hypothetical protein